MSRASESFADGVRQVWLAVETGAALRMRPLLYMVPVGTLTTAVAQVRLLESPRTVFWGLVTAVLGSAAAALLLMLYGWLSRTWLVLRQVKAQILTFAVVGAVRMLTIGSLHSVVGIPSLYLGITRFWTGAFQGLVWLALTSLYYNGRDRFIAERERLLDDQARMLVRAQHESALSQALARELAATVSVRVQESVSRTRAFMTLPMDLDESVQMLRRIAASLREAVDHDIRPISHELWEEPPSEQVRVDLPLLLRLGCYPQPYPIFWSALIAWLFTSGMAMSMPSPGWAVLMFILQLTCICVVLAVADLIVRVPGHRGAAEYWTGIIAAMLIASVPPLVMPQLGWATSQAVAWAVVCSLGGVLLMAATSIIVGLTGTRRVRLEMASASLNAADVAQRVRARELAEASRLLARHLHSSLQGRLMAISLELERAADERNPATATQALQRLDSLMETPLIGAFEPEPLDVVKALGTLVAEWSAVVDITLTLDLPDQEHCSACQQVLAVAEEAIANAVRHAHATRIEIAVQQLADEVLVRVRNDGVPAGRGVAGLGSQWLDSVSPERWSLTHDAGTGRMLLEVRFPVTTQVGHA